MTPEALREFCLALSQATETFPFGEELSVFKTSGNNKIFAIAPVDGDRPSVSLKCDPQDSIALQADFPSITPGYHLNKKHWITVLLDDSVPDDLVEDLISASHALVRPKIPRGSAQSN